MFKNILVPTDLSEKSMKALEIAVRMGSGDDGKITLLHVIETIEEAEDEEFKAFYQKLTERAQRKMEEIADRYRAEKEMIGKEIVFGNRVREIVRFAHNKDVDLIMLSSHRIETIDPGVGWATISYRVAILAHCPVMMVK